MRSTCEQRLVKQAFRFEIDPNRKQRVLLARSVGASRFVYNWGLAESRRAYEATGRRPRLRELQARLVTLKKTECPWLYDVSAHIGQQALADLDRAFERFFRGLKGERLTFGFPRFKKKGVHDSARLNGVKLSERHIRLRLPMIGRVRLKETCSERGFEGRILSATITRRADRWFCSLAVERERDLVPPRSVVKELDVVGVDLGLPYAAVIHDGAESRIVEPSHALRRNLPKLRRLDRQLARKQKGSRNRVKAKLRRARLHYKISCQRRDFLHQLSGSFAKTKSVIVLEDLHVGGMQRNKHLALSISDAGLGELRRQLAYKSDWYGARLLFAERFYPSTQTSSGCGCLNGRVKGYRGLKQCTFECDTCGLSLHRDENAAINLRRHGLNRLGDELGIVSLPEGLREVTPVREEGSGLPPCPAGETGLAEAGSVKPPQRHTQKRAERRAGTGENPHPRTLIVSPDSRQGAAGNG